MSCRFCRMADDEECICADGPKREIAALREQLETSWSAREALGVAFNDACAKLAAITKERDELKQYDEARTARNLDFMAEVRLANKGMRRQAKELSELDARLAEARATNEVLIEENGKLQKRQQYAGQLLKTWLDWFGGVSRVVVKGDGSEESDLGEEICNVCAAWHDEDCPQALTIAFMTGEFGQFESLSEENARLQRQVDEADARNMKLLKEMEEVRAEAKCDEEGFAAAVEARAGMSLQLSLAQGLVKQLQAELRALKERT